MEDARIIALYWSRSEEAIPATALRYGAYLSSIARAILASYEDAEECVNDTYLRAWNAMPPSRPSFLAAFLGKITRRLSIDRWRKNRAQSRGGGELPLALEELRECGEDGVEEALLREELVAWFQAFLDALPIAERRVFLSRYWYLESIAEIARRFSFSESKVKSMLHRTRGKLREAYARYVAENGGGEGIA